MAIRFDSDIRTVRAIRRFVYQLTVACGGSEQEASEIEIATGEVLNNAFEHAYRTGSGPLEMDLRYDDAKIELLLRDHGDPITDAPAIPRTPPAGPRGRGLYLVGQLTDESEIFHPWKDSRGTGVRLVKYLRRRARGRRQPVRF